MFKPTNIDKNIYVLAKGEVGNFSLHLMPPLNVPNGQSRSYLSVANSLEKFDDGAEVSYEQALNFFDTSYDEEKFMFWGRITFPHTHQGAKEQKWTIIFSNDLKQNV